MNFASHTRLGVLLAVAIATGAVTEGDSAEPSGLLRKLLSGQPITYLALGDSVTYGMSVRDPANNCFPAILARALREQFNHPEIKLVNAGDPGVTVARAGRYVPDRMTAVRPRLITIQYGGNDSRLGTDAKSFREDLNALVRGALRSTAYETIVCIPPLEDKFSDAEVAQGIRTVARKYSLPVSDLEGAMKRALPEFRGPFPWGEHPEEHSHAVMAKALYATLAERIGLPRDLSVRLRRTTRLAPSNAESLELTADIAGRAKTQVAVGLECGGDEFLATPTTAATGAASATFALPRNPGDMFRTGTARLWCTARTTAPEGTPPPFDFDVAWLSVAPTLAVGDERTVALGSDRASLGRFDIDSTADLSAEVSARWTNEHLVLVVDVTDSARGINNMGGAYENDCVELYFDARPAKQQGAPYYSRGVAMVFVVPYPGNPRVTWVLQKPPLPGWDMVEIESRWREGGYVVEVRLPRAALTTEEGKLLESLGFDVAIDDSDDNKSRESQLIWAGSTRNHLIPSEFGALDLRDGPAVPSIRVTVH